LERTPSLTLEVAGLRIQRQAQPGGRAFVLEVPRFTVGRGERVGFIGASGSGKTTFLELLGLLSRPAALMRFAFTPMPGMTPLDLAGPVLRGDADRLAAIRARWIGFILQDGGLLPYLSVRENARLAVELGLGPRAFDPAGLAALAGAIGVSELLDREPAALSGGQRQRAAVLRALAPGARLLIGDEPTAALDPASAADVMDAIDETARVAGATVVLASHNESLLRRHGYRIYRIGVDETPALRRATVTEIPAGGRAA
jgi:putative ABC transport system ATP-binding protein